MSLESNKIQSLKDRAFLLQAVRSFFSDRNILEVDTPLLSHSAPIDEHIDVMAVDLAEERIGYLHSSPEYAMKRLLSLGMGDIFQLGHVFRQGEVGRLHNPEFTLIEWYRNKMPFARFIEETVELIQLFLGSLPFEKVSYQTAFQTWLQIDPFQASQEELVHCALSHNISFSPANWDRDALLHLLLGSLIEPNLGQGGTLTVLFDYPASQAALAKTEEKQGHLVAKRFEVYYEGIELANGYHELTDANEQRKRLVEANEKRVRVLHKPPLPLDEHFLSALATQGLPECCGAAVGFDRLLLLRQDATSLQDVLPFSWTEV